MVYIMMEEEADRYWELTGVLQDSTVHTAMLGLRQ